MSDHFTIASVRLTNATGLHARPSVRLTQLARSFFGPVEVATGADGPWVDAKSPVKLMRFRAPRGTTLFVRSAGGEAEKAVRDVIALIAREFDEAEPSPDSDAHHG